VLALVHDEAPVRRGEPPLSLRDLGAELVRVDGVLVYLEERDVVVEDLKASPSMTGPPAAVRQRLSSA
jgi:hypothetical protein